MFPQFQYPTYGFPHLPGQQVHAKSEYLHWLRIYLAKTYRDPVPCRVLGISCLLMATLSRGALQCCPQTMDRLWRGQRRDHSSLCRSDERRQFSTFLVLDFPRCFFCKTSCRFLAATGCCHIYSVKYNVFLNVLAIFPVLAVLPV